MVSTGHLHADHRRVWVGRDLQGHLVPIPLLWAGYFPLDQDPSNLDWTGVEQFQVGESLGCFPLQQLWWRETYGLDVLLVLSHSPERQVVVMSGCRLDGHHLKASQHHDRTLVVGWSKVFWWFSTLFSINSPSWAD